MNKIKLAAANIALAALLLLPVHGSVAGAIEITGSVNSCDDAGCISYLPVGTPTYTQVIFDHNRIDRVGHHSYAIGQLHGSLRIWIDGELWTEQDDFEYWNERTPSSPERGWYSPRLEFQDGLLVGISFFSPNGGPGSPGLGIGFPDGFEFDVSLYGGPGSLGTLASVLPPFVAEPGSIAMLGLGLIAIGAARVIRRRTFAADAGALAT